MVPVHAGEEAGMKRDAGKEKVWREAIAEARRSGQSVREFCRQRGLKENLFYSWRRELKTRDPRSVQGRGGHQGRKTATAAGGPPG